MALYTRVAYRRGDRNLKLGRAPDSGVGDLTREERHSHWLITSIEYRLHDQLGDAKKYSYIVRHCEISIHKA